jgi:hypothetical protein
LIAMIPLQFSYASLIYKIGSSCTASTGDAQ